MTGDEELRVTDNVEALQAAVRALYRVLEKAQEVVDGPDHIFQIFLEADDFFAAEAALQAVLQSP